MFQAEGTTLARACGWEEWRGFTSSEVLSEVTDVRVLLLIEKKKKGIGTENRNRGEMNSYLVMGRGVS